MDKRFILLPVSLNLFDGGAAAPAAGGEGGAAGNPAETNNTPGSSRQAKKAGDLSNVRYGKQPEAALSPDAGGEQGAKAPVAEPTPEEKRAKWDELVKGEYKDQFTAATQQVIDRRFKEAKQLEAQREQLQPIMDGLMTKYGIKDNDLAALQAAMDRDNSLWEAEAEAKGLTIDQLRTFKQMERQNQAIAQENEALRRQNQAEQQARAWTAQAEKLKEQYPSFDLVAEIENPQFLSLLKAGIPVDHAFKVVHHDELMTGAIQATAKKAEQQVLDGIRTKSARPLENGAGAQGSAFTVKNDVSKLTAKDRAEIMRRARQGELIEF